MCDHICVFPQFDVFINWYRFFFVIIAASTRDPHVCVFRTRLLCNLIKYDDDDDDDDDDMDIV